jgi:hypothetical protein
MVVFKHWIENHWQDWQENDLLAEEFKKFVHRALGPSGLQKSADILTHLLHKKVSTCPFPFSLPSCLSPPCSPINSPSLSHNYVDVQVADI